MRVIGYLRVSSEEQGVSGLGLEAQEATIRAEVARRGDELVGLERDIASGGSMKRRPGLERCLDLLDRGEADLLIAAKQDRLSRREIDALTMMERYGSRILCLDTQVDTTTAAGRMVFGMNAVVSAHYRAVISEKTREALAAKKARGERIGGARFLADNVRQRIATMRVDGMTLQRIADTLQTEGVPTAKGGKRWYPSTIRAIIATA